MQMGYFASSSAVGVLLFAAIGGILADWFGRKPVVIGATALFGLACFATPWSTGFGSLLDYVISNRRRPRRGDAGGDRHDQRPQPGLAEETLCRHRLLRHLAGRHALRGDHGDRWARGRTGVRSITSAACCRSPSRWR